MNEASSCPLITLISIPVSLFTFFSISAAFTASRIADVAAAFRCFTSYTSINSLYDLMVFINLSAFSGDISPLSNTSKPRRSGTRTSAILMNSGEAEGDPAIVSLISILAALLPISMAASLNVGQGFFVQIIIGFYLGTDFFPVGAHILIIQFIIQPPGFYIILELYVQYIDQLLLYLFIPDRGRYLHAVLKIAQHPVC